MLRNATTHKSFLCSYASNPFAGTRPFWEIGTKKDDGGIIVFIVIIIGFMNINIDFMIIGLVILIIDFVNIFVVFFCFLITVGTLKKELSSKMDLRWQFAICNTLYKTNKQTVPLNGTVWRSLE